MEEGLYGEMLACCCNSAVHCYCSTRNLLNELLNMNYLLPFYLVIRFSEGGKYINIYIYIKYKWLLMCF